MKFTKEEIDLCKQVAEKHWGEICVGAWLYFEEGFYLVTEIIKTPENVDVYVTDFRTIISADDDFFPLWTISDCLEFFMERAIYLEGLSQILTNKDEYLCAICSTDDSGVVRSSVRSYEGKTPLEACLKAALAVLEDNEK